MKRTKHKTRDGVFAYTTTEGRRWGVDYRDPATRRRRRKRGFEKKELALLWKDRAEREELGLLELKPDAMAFEAVLDRYMDYRLAQGRKKYSYHHILGRWSKVFEGRPIRSITSEEIESLLVGWTKKERLSPATRNNALAQLSGLLSYAYGRKWIDSHPTEKGRVPLLAVDNARSRWLRSHEIEAVCQHSPDWLKPIVRFAAMTGMRRGEICGLRKSSFQVDDQGQAYVVTEEKTKGGERLTYPLEGWAREYVENKVRKLKFSGDYIFSGPEGRSATKALMRHFPDAVRKAGLVYGRKEKDGVTFHSLRHSMASLALNAGVPEVVVQRLGNWKTRKMVSRYAHLADETLRSGAAKLAELLDQKRSSPDDVKEPAPEYRAG